jgi:general secretion pathway protein G
MAIAALALGIAGLCTCGVGSLVGLVLGIVAMRQIGRSGGRLGGRGLAIAALVISAVGLVVGLVLGVFLGGSWLLVGERAQVMRTEMRRMEVRQALETTANALDVYELDMGHYPTEAEGGLQALVTPPPGAAGWTGPYVREVPVDTWGNPILYEPPDASRSDLGAATYRVFSAGPDGLPGTADDIER